MVPLADLLVEDPFVPGVREAMFGIMYLSCEQFLHNKREYMSMLF